MPTFAAVLLIGFFLGMRHATDPDHVVAVTTIVSRERTVFNAAVIGAVWGVGHTFTILVVGSAIILLKVAIPVRLGLAMEFIVGFMLILLGALNLSGLMQRAMEWIAVRRLGSGVHSHVMWGRRIAHMHDDAGDAVLLDHVSLLGWTPSRPKRAGLLYFARPLVVGIVHGLAGSAAVALLVLTIIRQPSWAVAYLLIFGIGTIAGMMLISTIIALPFAYTLQNFAKLNQRLALASAFVSLIFGLFLCYHTGIVDGLFRSHASWTPR